jgi:hypothetical protein
MNGRLKPGLAVGAVLLAGVGAGGVAFARDGGDSERGAAVSRDEVLARAASDLGVDADRLRQALRDAFSAELDEAVASGALTRERADRALERLERRGGFPLLERRHGGRGWGSRGPLREASSFLDLSPAELRDELREGKSLAEVARERGASVNGLVDALVEAKRARLREAVAAGRLTQEEADRKLDRLRERVDALVERQPGARPFGGRSGRGGDG